MSVNIADLYAAVNKAKKAISGLVWSPLNFAIRNHTYVSKSKLPRDVQSQVQPQSKVDKVDVGGSSMRATK